MIIKKIFEGEFDDQVHNQFLKFSRGEFKNKYLINGKKQATKWAVKTGAEFANNFVYNALKNIEGEVHVKGIIISTIDLRDEIKFDIAKVGNFQGIRKNQIDTTVNPQEILDLMEKYPKVFFALSFKTDDIDLKIKAKAPKDAKAGKGDEDIKADFCTIKTSNPEVIRPLFFDCGLNFKEISINHTLNITGIVYPEDMESLKPAEVREKAKREGILTRKIILDGRETVTEAKFIA